MERYGAYKDSGVKWLGSIPASWKCGRIRSAYALRKELVEDGEPNELVSVSEYYGVDYRRNRISSTDVLARADSLEGYQRCCPNDLIMNIMLAWKGAQGTSAIAGLVSPSYGVFRPRDGSCPRYFHYLFRLDHYWEYFKSYSSGIIDSRLRLYPEVFMRLNCHVPPFLEQQAIADYLDAKTAEIDALVADCEREVGLLREYRKAVISEAVTKGLDPDAPMKDSGVEWIGEIPRDWDAGTIASVTNMITNGYVGPTRDLFVEDGVRYLQSLHVVDGELNFSKHPYFVSEEWSAQHSRSILVEGDVLVVQTGAIGNCAYVSEQYAGCNCHALIILRPNEKLIMGRFLFYYLYSDIGKEKVLLTRTGATHPHLNSTKIRFTSVVVPPISEQQRIVAFLDAKTAEIDSLIEAKQQMADKLREYRKSLISEAVTGKFKVPGVK